MASEVHLTGCTDFLRFQRGAPSRMVSLEASKGRRARDRQLVSTQNGDLDNMFRPSGASRRKQRLNGGFWRRESKQRR